MDNENNVLEDDVLEQAKKHVEDWFLYFSENIQSARKDMRFLYVDQWDEDGATREKRAANYKLSLTNNMMHSTVRNIIGSFNKIVPGIIVRSANENDEDIPQQVLDDVADKLRYDLTESRLSLIQERLFNHVIGYGFAVGKVYTDYDKDSFNQHVCFEAVDDPTAVFFDPNAKELDKSDGEYCGIYRSYSKDEFKAKYKKDVQDVQSFEKTESMPTSWAGWDKSNYVTVVEYYKKEYDSYTLCLLSDQSVVKKDDFNELSKRLVRELGLKSAKELPIQIEKERVVKNEKIVCYILTRDEILEQYDCSVTRLPFIYSDAESIKIDGKAYVKSYINPAKDTQKYLNYLLSESADAVVRLRDQQYLVTTNNVGKDKHQAEQWEAPNEKTVLFWNPDPMNGGAQPTVIPASQISPSLIQQYQAAQQDVQNALGRFDANLGKADNAVSGVAINARAVMGNVTVQPFVNSVINCLESMLLCAISAYKTIYDNDNRTIKLQNTRGQIRSRKINTNILIGSTNRIFENEYKVSVKMAMSFTDQKENARAQLTEMAQIVPALSETSPDLMVEYLDVPNTQEFAKRVETTLPPQIKAMEGKPVPPPAPNPALQLEQMKMQNDAMEQQNKQRELQIRASELALKEQELGLNHQAAQARAMAEMTKSNNEVQKTQIETAAALAKHVDSNG